MQRNGFAYRLCEDSKRNRVDDERDSSSSTHHVAENEDVRTDEIVTFLEDRFARIVFRLIADAENRSLKIDDR